MPPLSEARTAEVATNGLTGVAETLLIPLLARAVESRRPDALVHDALAEELSARLPIDRRRIRVDKISQTAIALRTSILDRETTRFLAEHPQALIANLGAGLCTRSLRIAHPQATWVDLDLPQVAQLREQLGLLDAQPRFVAKSLLDFSWLDDIAALAAGRAVLFIAEGLFMYFAAADVRRVLGALAERFAGSELLFEALSPELAHRTHLHPAVAKTSARFQWGLGSPFELEAWGIHARILGHWPLLDPRHSRWGLLRPLFALHFFQRQLMIVHARFEVESPARTRDGTDGGE